MGEINPTQWGKLSAFPCFSHHCYFRFIISFPPRPPAATTTTTSLFHHPAVTRILSGHPLRQNKHTAAESIDSSQRLCTNFLLIDRRPSPPPPPVSFQHSSLSTHFRYDFSFLFSPVPCFLLPLFILTFASSLLFFPLFLFLPPTCSCHQSFFTTHIILPSTCEIWLHVFPTLFSSLSIPEPLCFLLFFRNTARVFLLHQSAFKLP